MLSQIADLRDGLKPFGRGRGGLLDFGNKTAVEFAHHRRQILHDFLPLGGVANGVLPVEGVRASYRDCQRRLESDALNLKSGGDLIAPRANVQV